MGKHGIIEDSRKRCRCGRIKPAARAVCYTCKPRYSRKEPPVSICEPYTLPDRVAQARACGISYGQLMRIVELGAAIPAIRPVEWPSGSVHEGECV